MTGPSHQTSHGHNLASSEWLDVHFEAWRGEYEQMYRYAGFEPGWKVLDAGCGGGNYIPWIANDIGADGGITALDFEARNVEMVQARVEQQWNLACPVEAVEGSVADLPFDDGSFDGIWCANTVAYLTEEDFELALSEFRRVVRPGGLVAIKDFYIGFDSFQPAPLGIWGRQIEAAAGQGMSNARWALNSWNLHRMLEHAGFVDVRQSGFLVERRAPLDEYNHAHLTGLLGLLHSLAPSFDLSDEDQAWWASAANPESPEFILNHPDFYRSAGNVVAVGRAPD